MATDMFKKQHNLGYNHAIDPEYQQLRAQAIKSNSVKQYLAAKSLEAIKKGDKHSAKKLITESCMEAERSDSFNLKAAEYAFDQNNANLLSNEIDLHGLFAKEAVQVLKKRLVLAAEAGEKQLRVITGKGIHSPGMVCKLQVEALMICHDLDLNFDLDSSNSGVIIINIDRSNISSSKFDMKDFPFDTTLLKKNVQRKESVSIVESSESTSIPQTTSLKAKTPSKVFLEQRTTETINKPAISGSESCSNNNKLDPVRDLTTHRIPKETSECLSNTSTQSSENAVSEVSSHPNKSTSYQETKVPSYNRTAQSELMPSSIKESNIVFNLFFSCISFSRKEIEITTQNKQ
ncbi:Smr domain profile [Nakaseomyces glabratus]|nr:Smr domain profile [Nakaseomyces glabratus]KAH7593472.1 Smr domain profile [Nakaseomyces glabratus]